MSDHLKALRLLGEGLYFALLACAAAVGPPVLGYVVGGEWVAAAVAVVEVLAVLYLVALENV